MHEIEIIHNNGRYTVYSNGCFIGNIECYKDYNTLKIISMKVYRMNTEFISTFLKYAYSNGTQYVEILGVNKSDYWEKYGFTDTGHNSMAVKLGGY